MTLLSRGQLALGTTDVSDFISGISSRGRGPDQPRSFLHGFAGVAAANPVATRGGPIGHMRMTLAPPFFGGQDAA